MTFVKAYTNDETLEKDVNKLKDNNISSGDIFILSHDDDRTARIVKNTEASGVDYNKKDIGDFEKQGDELREKLRELGVSDADAHEYEEDMDEGKVFLIVKNDTAEGVLS
ncbi:general stress protein [Oceanobacillus neutriphilus]|uniref:General stress protein 17M n=1 Tax=Oceanobacillus neutriphilus TaxID=531815 RepID=A0ABQ2NRT3_9BACI|nr:general stress protein [Oceanobacillus neutriphilus]GGP10188.1 general stress protein 17M [Oceanobacillus neutriphilus]